MVEEARLEALEGGRTPVADGEEGRLEAWDFVHCPPGTDHIFVGAGGTETASPSEAYASWLRWHPGRPG
jgi:hypothetical protein